MGAQVTPVTETFILGSGDVLIGDDVTSLVSLGAANSIKFEESFEKIEMEIDNAGKIDYGIKNQEAIVSGEFLEIDLERLADARGGIDTYSTTAGVLVSGAEQEVSSGDWGFDNFIELENQNYDESEPTVNSVTGSVDGAGAADDYDVVCVNGKWGIVPKDGTNFEYEDQDLTINYDYTPAASKSLSSGGKVSIDPKVVRILHTDEDGNTFSVTLYSAKIQEGMTLEFPSDNADEAMAVPFSFKGTCDTSRTVGDQLFVIEDTRSY